MRENSKRQVRRAGRPFVGICLVSAVILTALLLANARGQSPVGDVTGGPATDIAIEHSSPLTVSITISTGKNRGIAEFSAESADTISVSVPATWEKREVRGGALAAVTSDPASFGFVRWHLPPHLTLSFWTPPIAGLAVRNPSPTPILVLSKRVNIVTGVVDERSVLVKDQATVL